MTKKYVSLEKLTKYDELLKAKMAADDAAALQSAKDYADSLASNYDAVGAAATAEQNAKQYTDALANGAVAANTAAIEKLNGTGTGSVAKAVADAKSELEAAIDAVDAKAIQNAADIDVLEGKVQGLIEGTYDDTELRGLVTANANAIQALSETHATDKGALEDAIAAEKERAEGIEGGLRTDVDAIKADYLKGADKEDLQGAIDEVAEDVAAIAEDYLKAADKTELDGKINAKADQTALDAEIERATGVEEGLQNQINLIMNNPDTKDVIDSIAEFTQYVADHGTIADGFRTDIDKNKDDIAALDTAYKAADTAIKGRLDVLEAIDHNAYVAADTALENKLTAEINKKADSDVVTGVADRVTALETASATHALKTEVEAVSTALTEYKDAHKDDYTNAQVDAAIKVVSDAVAALGDTYATDDELATAIAAAKEDASNKDAVVLAEAQKATAAVQSVVDTHVANEEIHVTAADKTKWNAALQAADITTGSSNGTIAVKGTDVAVKGLGSAAYKAETAFDAAGAADAALASAKTYTDEAVAKFVEVSEAEILALFGTQA